MKCFKNKNKSIKFNTKKNFEENVIGIIERKVTEIYRKKRFCKKNYNKNGKKFTIYFLPNYCDFLLLTKNTKRSEVFWFCLKSYICGSLR